MCSGISSQETVDRGSQPLSWKVVHAFSCPNVCMHACVTYTVQRTVIPLFHVTHGPVCECGCVCILSNKKDLANTFSCVKFRSPRVCAFEFHVTFLSLTMDGFISISPSSDSFHTFFLPWKKKVKPYKVGWAENIACPLVFTSCLATLGLTWLLNSNQV